MTSTELVARTVADTVLVKEVGRLLEARSPDEGAAGLLLDAYDDGRAPAWLTAYLLGCLRARSGYEVVREILTTAPGLLAESYAGVALAKIAGVEAKHDLIEIMERAPSRQSREGAVYGLSALRDTSSLEAILNALRSGRILRGCAGSAFVALEVPSTQLIKLLRSEDETERAAAMDAVHSHLAREGGLRDATLARAAREVLRARRVRLAPRVRAVLEERITALIGTL